MKKTQAELFKVLGVETRIQIIDLLKQQGPLGVNEMSQMLGITPSAVSQHLKILRHAGLVRNERKGYWIPYEIDPAALERCGELLSAVCTCGCKGTGRLRDAKPKSPPERLAVLAEYELELRAELQRVRDEIREVKGGDGNE